MKKTLLLALIIVSGIIGGCSKMEESSELDKARKELENHNFDVAQDILSELLNDYSGNEQARAMYLQARKMSSALKYEQNQDYDKAITELNDIVNINNGSSVIKKESINKKEELEKLEAQREKDALNRKSNAKSTTKKYNSKSELEIIKQQQSNQNDAQEDSSDETTPSEDNATDENNLDNIQNLNNDGGNIHNNTQQNTNNQ